MTACYGVVTRADNTVTTVVRGATFSPLFRTVRPEGRRHSRYRARSGSRAVRSDRPAVCAEAAKPGHRCFDRKCLREVGWLATSAPAKAAVEALRERPATTHIRLCSARPAWHRGRGVSGHDVQAASPRTCSRPAPDRGLVRPVPFPVAAALHGRAR